MTYPDEQISLGDVEPIGASAAAEADQPPRGRRQLVALGVTASVLAGALVVSSLGRPEPAYQQGSPYQQGPVAGSRSAAAVGSESSSRRDVLAGAALQRQEQALRAGARRGYVRSWDSKLAASRRRAATLYANLQALHATVRSTRYVAAAVGGLPLQQQRRLGGDTWTAEVQLSWRLRGFDSSDALATLRYTFVQRGDVAYVVDIAAAPGTRRPVWLLGPLVVRRDARTLVAATTPGDADRIDRRLHQAVVDVGSVVSDWRGGLVAYVPAGTEQLEAVLAATPGGYSHVAAVTTSVDGSHQVDAPVAIVINPAVFADLSPVGAHVVITHESTHVATEAAAIDVPLWLAEGFADYVGVGSVEVPLPVSAGALVRDVRRHGLPDALPSDADFDSARGDLEVYYEQAWLAARLIAREHGEARLLAFYERVVANPDRVAQALRICLHTTRSALTAEWRTYLRAVVGAA